MARGGGESFRCPECGGAASRHDSRRRRWRHLPTCQYRTILTADVPRVRCAEHGVRTVGVPWSDPGSRFTALFEALVIDWLGEASISAVARLLDLSWDQVDGVMERAVKRGLERRGSVPASRVLGVDETSFQKRHEYVTVVAAIEGESRVHHVADGRGKDALSSYFEGLPEAELSKIETESMESMDMWPAYISATLSCLPDGGDKIAYDKFHVAARLGGAVDEVRREEQRRLRRRGFTFVLHAEPSEPGKMRASGIRVPVRVEIPVHPHPPTHGHNLRQIRGEVLAYNQTPAVTAGGSQVPVAALSLDPLRRGP